MTGSIRNGNICQGLSLMFINRIVDRYIYQVEIQIVAPASGRFGIPF